MTCLEKNHQKCLCSSSVQFKSSIYEIELNVYLNSAMTRFSHLCFELLHGRGNDQVCSYRCITSHESPNFEKFAYCILQRNNCMGYKALSPSYPNPAPMKTFRSEFNVQFVDRLTLPSTMCVVVVTWLIHVLALLNDGIIVEKLSQHFVLCDCHTLHMRNLYIYIFIEELELLFW